MSHPFKVLIAGAGVAGLEAALALRELAGNRVSTTLLAPEPDFTYRPMRVREPFAYRTARRYPLDEIARDIGAELRQATFSSLDGDRRIVQTDGGEELAYDALLLALGARIERRFEHALTLDDRRLDEQLRGLIQDIEADYLHSVAFVVPAQMAWPLPIYELALMTARRAWDMNVDLSAMIVTPEDAPLAIFGVEASRAVSDLLSQHRIEMITSAHAEVPAPGEVMIHPSLRQLHAKRVIALPELVGPGISGLPRLTPNGFIPVDSHGRVSGLEHVYAAGDAVDFPVKHGGIAAQQADAAAESIAALSGAPVEPRRFRPMIQGILLGGRRPLYMRAHITGGHGTASEVSDEPLSLPVTKIAAKHLSPFLDALDRTAVR